MAQFLKLPISFGTEFALNCTAASFGALQWLQLDLVALGLAVLVA